MHSVVDSDLIKISSQLENAGKALIANPTDGKPLRHAGIMLSDLQYDVKDKSLRFISFFLSNFVEDLFYNLSGDIPFNEFVLSAQHSLFSKTGEFLCDIAKIVENRHEDDVQATLENMIFEYIETIIKLNHSSG